MNNDEFHKWLRKITPADGFKKLNKTDKQGRKQGHWIQEYDPGIGVGLYVDGKEHGEWVVRHPDGTVEKLDL